MKERPGFLSDLPTGDFITRNSSDGFIRIVDTPPPVEQIIETPLVDPSIRNMHVNITGKIGMGKSTLICWWALQDIIEKRGGVCVIDPKGDLVDELLRWIPEDRADDCIVADIKDPLPLDFISCEPDNEDDVVADLKYMLMGEMADNPSYPMVNKNIENLLYSLINANTHAYLNTEEGEKYRCTFLDVSEFWENEVRRTFIRKHLSDPKLIDVWNKKLPNETDREKITSRISPFVRNKALSKIFGDPKPRLDIREVIREKKILLVRVPVHKSASAIYGKLLMAKIQHAMFSVEDESKRVPFFLYVDEFQNFPTSEKFEEVIDMGRGFMLCFTLSVTRIMHHLITPSMRSAIRGLGSYALLQLNPEDVSFYESQFDGDDQGKSLRDRRDKAHLDWQIAPEGDARDRLFHRYKMLDQMAIGVAGPPLTVQNALRLPKYRAMFKIGEDPPFIAQTPTPGPKVSTQQQIEKVKRIKDQSKLHYGPRAVPFAESVQNRSGDNASCNSPTAPHTEVNGNTDSITRTGSPTPPHLRKDKNS